MGSTNTNTSSLLSNSSITTDPAPTPIFFPNSGNLYPKFADRFPRTAVEVWLFDTLAQDGGNAFTVSFLRDSMAAPAGFRVAVNANWPDGTNCSHNLIFPESIVTIDGPNEENGSIFGIWRAQPKDDGSDAPSATFEVSEDLATAKVTFNAPGQIQGTLTLQSQNFPCLPQTEEEAKASSDLFWMRPIARASATLEVELTLPDATTKHMRISPEQGGYGGLERSWEGMPWTKAITDSVFIRAQAGPYYIQIMRLIGRPEKNYEATATARLYCDGKLVCTALKVIPSVEYHSKSADAITVDKLFDAEGVAATYRAKNVGYKIELLSKAGWTFELRHARAWWSWPTSKPGPEATGSEAFVVKVKGGLVGSGDVYEGFGMAGQVEMPE